MKVLLVVGQHAPDFGDEEIEIVAQENVTFPATAEECQPVLVKLALRAQEAGAALLLQNTPGQVAIALATLAAEASANREHAQTTGRDRDLAARYAFFLPFERRIGAIISRPAPAEGRREIVLTPGDMYCYDGPDWSELVAQAVAFVNPNATVDAGNDETLISVEAPRPFVFSHIEWL